MQDSLKSALSFFIFSQVLMEVPAQKSGLVSGVHSSVWPGDNSDGLRIKV